MISVKTVADAIVEIAHYTPFDELDTSEMKITLPLDAICIIGALAFCELGERYSALKSLQDFVGKSRELAK